MSREPDPWSVKARLAEVQRAPVSLELKPDEATRRRIARALDLVDLPGFEAEATLRPWLDGLELHAAWRAVVVQTCGVTLDPFDTRLQGELTVKAAPRGSPALAPEGADVVIDPEAEDPPDPLEGDDIDVGAYLVEALALELDPFPRKPGATYEEPLPAETPPSPFAVLERLKRGSEPGEGG